MSTPSSASRLAIGIDMGGTSVKIAVCRGAELLSEKVRIATDPYKEKPAMDLIDAVAAVVQNFRVTYPAVEAVGFGVPGFTSFADGKIYNLTNVPGWKNLELNKVFSAKTGLPTFAENDANAMVYAEYVHGAGRACQATNMIGVTLGTGVGGGLVLNGKLFRGSFSGAGEIGQMSIDYQGKAGHYGNTGSLEKYVGNNQTAARAKAIYEEAGRSLPPVEKPNYSPEAICRAAQEDDPHALRVWDEFTSQLAACLSSCIYLLNPDTLVIGGGVAQAGEILFAPLKRKLKYQLAGPFIDDLQVVPAHFSNDAGIIGSAAVALNRLDDAR
jgi:glucokinase